MKIKDVIEQTGLTDRAIRLYIANGLIAPKNQKSYTGRNNYDFTEDDVELLQQIALLRKADFSIEQIKVILQGSDAARETINKYIKDKHAELERGQHIVSALESLPEEGEISVIDICAKIEDGLSEEPIPQADMKPSKWETFEKWIMRILSISVIAFFSLLLKGVFIVYGEEFPFYKFYTNLYNYIGISYVLLPIVLSAIILILYLKVQLIKAKRKKRRIIAIVLMVITFYIAIQPMGIGALNWLPPVYSETDNPENYMIVGTYVQAYGNSVRKLFPATIPKSAVADGANWYPPDKFPETTKYYYYYQRVIDPSFDIYAEWVLTEEEYIFEKQRIDNYYPEGPCYKTQWGDWTCLSFTSDDLSKANNLLSHYYYLLFAYNDETNTVRYIASYAMDTGGTEEPYFLELEW